jgi:S-adenosylmethionine hydrolase
MLVTLLSDQGVHSLFISRLKAGLYQRHHELNLLDVNLQVEPFDINEASFILSQLIPECEKQSIHLAMVDISEIRLRPIIAKYKDQFIITSNNGLLSVMESMASISFEFYSPASILSDDALKSDTDAIIEMVDAIVNHTPLPAFSETEIVVKNAARCVISNGLLTGQIVYIDHLRNCYTNISKSYFNKYVGKAEFTIHLSRHEEVNKISENKMGLDDGEAFCTFDHLGYLQIGIFKGRGADLLGLKKGSKINIDKG